MASVSGLEHYAEHHSRPQTDERPFTKTTCASRMQESGTTDQSKAKKSETHARHHFASLGRSSICCVFTLPISRRGYLCLSTLKPPRSRWFTVHVMKEKLMSNAEGVLSRTTCVCVPRALDALTQWFTAQMSVTSDRFSLLAHIRESLPHRYISGAEAALSQNTLSKILLLAPKPHQKSPFPINLKWQINPSQTVLPIALQDRRLKVQTMQAALNHILTVTVRYPKMRLLGNANHECSRSIQKLACCAGKSRTKIRSR